MFSDVVRRNNAVPELGEQVLFPGLLPMKPAVVDEQIGVAQDVRDLDPGVLGKGHQEVGRAGLDDELPIHRLSDLHERPHAVYVPRVERREHGLPFRPTGRLDALRFHEGLGEVGSGIGGRHSRPLGDEGDRFVRLRCIDEVFRHLRMGSVLSQVARVGDRPPARMDQESVGGGGGMVNVNRFDVHAVRVHARTRAEGPVIVGEQVHAARRDLPGVQDDLRADAQVNRDRGIQEPEMVRVVEVDVGDERGREPRCLVGQARPVEPLGPVESGELR